MKRTLLFIGSLMLLVMTTFAQSPEAFKYQAVARDASGQILANQSVAFRISILQGGTSGTSVYSETHAAFTNTFGLVNLAIGDGVVGTGDFFVIDWGSDSYFVQIELDETGGNNFQLMGASQLLSVPYALHTKTAESVPNDADTDPTNELQDISLTDHDLTLSGGSTITLPDEINDADADPINEIELPEGGADGQVLSTDGSGNYSWTDQTTTYSVGDFAHGGVVFWVDQTGTHGLVCAIEDQSTGTPWSNGVALDTKTMREGIYGGAFNTERITDAQGRGNYAAFICAQYSGGDYGDWYLPAKGELDLMFQNKAIINATATANGGDDFTTDFYWNSTELDNGTAWGESFNIGLQGNIIKSSLNRVRSVRAF